MGIIVCAEVVAGISLHLTVVQQIEMGICLIDTSASWAFVS
jgi:hypothetical protein